MKRIGIFLIMVMLLVIKNSYLREIDREIQEINGSPVSQDLSAHVLKSFGANSVVGHKYNECLDQTCQVVINFIEISRSCINGNWKETINPTLNNLVLINKNIICYMVAVGSSEKQCIEEKSEKLKKVIEECIFALKEQKSVKLAVLSFEAILAVSAIKNCKL